ncbi:Fic family protein [Adlercreutzia sp. ZJ138]|uniref:Fic family protein n=1 Tax=Adlercreutzia sp. ZJ138 TaxID=2709405 RepID=UPI0013ED7097|nr:Fic family protein [Adlercreutzia sp. ZJ138]
MGYNQRHGQERSFDYTVLLQRDAVAHLARFISNVWQVHPFGEGNTRTTAVFAIKYLRTLGFDADNDLFAAHSWFFRNSLVRANYADIQAGIREDASFLEAFFRNLLLGENNEIKNRYLHLKAKGLSSQVETINETIRAPWEFV